ncbi:MAG: GTPase domain-containing protein, partial [Methylococcales bacterium]
MAYDYSDLTAQTRQWAEQATAKGWLTETAAQQLVDFDLRTPGSLFNKDDSRPLIVAFMGGTGVGKSSLLNRLAGSAIAKAGVERPTSKEVTLFHHHSVVIDHLPERLPLEHINIAQHSDERNKAIIWMDMPDFDSTEQANKQQVLQWLPHIDVLIYVVSPERYRDEKAWRLLLAEGGKHAWLFVINQWDKGQIEQYADFKQQLHKAEFIDPLIFTTSCAETIPTDEFTALQETILSLATNHVVQQLQQRGLQVKTRELKQKLHDCRQSLGSEQSIQQLQHIWQEQWQKTCAVLQQGFAWPIQKMAAYYGEHAADLITNAGVQPKLWDTWAQARYEDAVDEVIAHSDQLQIPVNPIKKQLAVNRDKAANTMQSQTELAARQALANPGHAVQRLFLK